MGGRSGPAVPPTRGGQHPKGRNEMENPGAQRSGLRPAAAGLQGSDAHLAPSPRPDHRLIARAPRAMAACRRTAAAILPSTVTAKPARRASGSKGQQINRADRNAARPDCPFRSAPFESYLRRNLCRMTTLSQNTRAASTIVMLGLPDRGPAPRPCPKFAYIFRTTSTQFEAVLIRSSGRQGRSTKPSRMLLAVPLRGGLSPPAADGARQGRPRFREEASLRDGASVRPMRPASPAQYSP